MIVLVEPNPGLAAEHLLEDAAAGIEDGPPRVALDQVAGPERHRDRDDERRRFAERDATFAM